MGVKREIAFSTFFTKEKPKNVKRLPQDYRNTWYSGKKADFLISSPIFVTK